MLRACLLMFIYSFCSLAYGAPPSVVVTIKPIYGLVAQIMNGVGTPELLLPDYVSPHTFQLKPSHRRQLQQASLIIWVGPGLETFLDPVLAQLKPEFGVMTVIDIPGLNLLPLRHDRQWQHDDDHAHEHGSSDPHIWLSTDNAARIVKALTEKFIAIDPEHAALYQSNAAILSKELIALKKELNTLLSPVKTKPFLVYHDGYQYFDREFALNSVGTLVLNPQLPLSAKGLAEIRALIQRQAVQCVFKETEFSEQMIKKSLSEWNVKVAELDPLGAEQPKNNHAYQNTLLALGKRMRECLKSSP